MTRLVLGIDDEWPLDLLAHLSTLIDLQQLNEIYFVCDNCCSGSSTINAVLKQACNVRTLGLSYYRDLTTSIEKISSLVSSQIVHLKVQTKNIDFMKLTIERFEHLSSITFVHHQSLPNFWMEIIEWLIEKRRHFLLKNDHRSLQVWLNKNTSEQSEIKTDHKRVKLTHREHDS